MPEFVDTTHARDRAGYVNELEALEAKAICPFCPGYLDTRPEERDLMLHQIGGWRIKFNSYPHRHSARYSDHAAGERARGHFLFFPDEHKTDVTQLDESDWAALSLLLKWVHTEFSIEGCGLAMRSGATKYTGATVRHLHMQLLVPQLSRKTGRAKVIRVPIG